MTSRRGNFRKGLSLIELIVVVAILAATAGMVVSLTGKMDDRNRYEMTVKKLGEIRAAILGPNVVSPDGQLMTGGYLQDVGWLPFSQTDLIEKPSAVAAMSYNSTWRTWAGWRGPYMAAGAKRTSDSTTPPPYDDYGNNFYNWPDENSTQQWWQRTDISDLLKFEVRSMCADGKKASESGSDEADVFKKDYPTSDQPLIIGEDWVTNLEGLRVEVINMTASDFSTSTIQVRFRIIVPRWNEPDPLGYVPTAPDTDDFIGRSFSLDTAAAGHTLGQDHKEYNFANSGRTIWIPNGRRMLFLVDASTYQPLSGYRAYAELAVSNRVANASVVKLYIRN